MTPVLELEFREVGGSPCEGRATVRFQGEPFPVREGLLGDQREEIRWYIEQYMDFPEGGHTKRAERIEDVNGRKRDRIDYPPCQNQTCLICSAENSFQSRWILGDTKRQPTFRLPSFTDSIPDARHSQGHGRWRTAPVL